VWLPEWGRVNDARTEGVGDQGAVYRHPYKRLLDILVKGERELRVTPIRGSLRNSKIGIHLRCLITPDSLYNTSVFRMMKSDSDIRMPVVEIISFD